MQRIRFGEPVEIPLMEEILPPDELIVDDDEIYIARLRDEPFQVYFVDHVFKDVIDHLRGNPHVETGGVLVGHPFRLIDDDRKKFVVISGAIRQDSDDRSIGHFTVGTREIANARAELERNFPGLVVVGWYHSHPGHGIFLSGQDMTIVRSIYNAEWHIAMVVDSQQGRVGFFQGAEGKRLSGYLRLSDKPIMIKAIAQYNQATEMLDGDEPIRAREFLTTLDRMTNRSDMIHWQERGGYRDVKQLLHQLFEDSTDSIPPQNSLPSIASEDQTHENQQQIDALGIPKRYQEATQKLRRAFKDDNNVDLAKLSEAKQIFDWIDDKAPGYQNVDLLIDAIKRIEKLAPVSRPTRPRTNLVQNIFEALEPHILQRLQEIFPRDYRQGYSPFQSYSTESHDTEPNHPRQQSSNNTRSN